MRSARSRSSGRGTAGAVSLDLAQAEQSLAAQRAAQTQLIQQRTENRHALAILFDRPPQRARPSRPAARRGAAGSRGRPAREPARPASRPARGGIPAARVAGASRRDAHELLSDLHADRAGRHVEHEPRARADESGRHARAGALPFIQWNTMQLQIKVSKSQYEEAVVGFRQKLYGARGSRERAVGACAARTRSRTARAVAGSAARRTAGRRASRPARPPCSRGSTSSSGCATRKAPTS